MITDDIDPDLVAFVKALNTRVGQLKAEAAAIEKHKAALSSECEVLKRSLDDLSNQRIELQKAVNAAKADLIKIQQAQAQAQGAYDEARSKILRLTG